MFTPFTFHVKCCYTTVQHSVLSFIDSTLPNSSGAFRGGAAGVQPNIRFFWQDMGMISVRFGQKQKPWQPPIAQFLDPPLQQQVAFVLRLRGFSVWIYRHDSLCHRQLSPALAPRILPADDDGGEDDDDDDDSVVLD